VLAPLALGLLILIACLAAGRITLHLLGARRPTWLAGAVGFAVLTIAAGSRAGPPRRPS
jgi:hypothetical protein